MFVRIVTGMLFSPISVLLVEKYPVVCLGMRAMLKAPGIRVVGETGTLAEALELLKKLPANVIVAHVRPTEMKELALVPNLKEKYPKLSVVVMTRSQEPEDLLRAVLWGCSGYVNESVDRTALARIIRAVSSGECVLPRTLLRELLERCPREPVASAGKDKVDRLTKLERSALALIVEGASNRQIAEKLGCSVSTVKACVQKIIEKLEVSDRTQAAVRAVRLGIIR